MRRIRLMLPGYGVTGKRLAVMCALAVLLPSLAYAVELQPETAAAFTHYIQVTEQRMDDDLHDGCFLVTDRLPEAARERAYTRLRQGHLFIERLHTSEAGEPIPIPGGLVHHWVGVLYIPGATLPQTLAVLQDYNDQSVIYAPDVRESKILANRGNDFEVYMQYYRKSLVTVVLNVTSDVRYTALSDNRSMSKSYSTRIAEVENAGKSDQRELPVEDDHGYLWRIYSYWRVEEKDGGVFIQVEAIGLSRTIPAPLLLLVKPLIERIPRSELTNLLTDTRTAVETAISAKDIHASQPK